MFFAGFTLTTQAQYGYWQQEIDYKMDIDFDVKKHQYKGVQKVVYKNNSPDTLNKIFYHLYFNAFQPGSMMDMRNRVLPDPSSKIKGRIPELSSTETGYHKIKSLKQNGSDVKFHMEGTILEVTLNKPLLPGKKARLDMKWDAQVPIQIRRSGRNNREGIAYSMTQWYPKVCEYDFQGWHANPYVGREFHGVWGDFAVNIKIHKDYVLGGSGLLQNPQEAGHGFQKEGEKLKKQRRKKRTWKYVAKNVHDFAWAADPDYKVVKRTMADGVDFYFIYQPGEKTDEVWEALPEKTEVAYNYINLHFGKYPYPQYTVIQGGDGGMEYPMITLITGFRSERSLVGVTVHELLHMWYQCILATNEALYAWMDEGFTSYASARTMKHVYSPNSSRDPLSGTLRGYAAFAKTGGEEPLSTHADHFETNRAYGVGSYTKGAVYLHQLEYIMGEKNFAKGLKRYYNTWKFKHPTPNDFIRVMEKQSGLELDWYNEYMVNSTHTIDYLVKEVRTTSEGSLVKLEKLNQMPMPVEVQIDFEDGSSELWYIPMRIMRGEKKDFKTDLPVKTLDDWPWTHTNYQVVVPADKKIKGITIDPQRQTADVDVKNNVWPREEEPVKDN